MSHIPVLLNESVDCLLNGRKSGIFIDATLGGGSTSEKILEQIDCNGKVIGIDQDPDALEIATRRLSPYTNFTAVRNNFRVLDQIMQDQGLSQIDGLIADLGVSSMQLDNLSRAFGFKSDARLDMRMDPDCNGTSAYDLVNNLDEESLRRVFKEYGQERWAGRIASRIVENRLEKKIETPAQLAKLVEDSIPKKFHSRRIHPATRIFLALRIEVNDELGSLKELLQKAMTALGSGGRIVIISYHSLEDRIVKWTFRENAQKTGGGLKIITKKPLTPGEEEIENNRRSRSAKMRVAEKV